MKKTTTTQTLTSTFTLNWSTIKIPFYLWIGLSCIGLFSCDESEEIGLNLQADQVLNTSFTDTVAIETSVFFRDSINTTNRPLLLIGKIENERFGTSYAEAYSQLSIGNVTDFDFGEGAVYDSITISLGYEYTYGDTLTPKTYVIHEIEETIDSNQYYNFDRIEAIGNEVGQFTFAPGDTSLSVTGIRLNDSFGRKIFNIGGQPEFANQASFVQFLKGIRIAPLEGETGTMIGFNSTGSQSFITLHYQGPSGDSLVAREFIFAFGRGFNYIAPDLSTSSTISDLTRGSFIDTELINNEILIQGGTGINTLIEFPNLENFGNGRRVLVNRAELFFRPIEGLNDEPNKPPPSVLRLRQVNSDGSLGGFIPRELSISEPASSTYNESGRGYIPFRMTTYIQRIIDGDEPNNGLLLSLAAGVEQETVTQVILGDAKHPTSPPMQLQLYYTVLDE